MKKSLIFLLALAATTALMASSENNAVRFTQDGQSSKWYYVASTPSVTFSDEGISVNNGQSYNFADGIITSVFFSAPEVNDDFTNYYYDYSINYTVTSVGESNTARVRSGHNFYLPAELEIPATATYKDMTFDVTELYGNAFAGNTHLPIVRTWWQTLCLTANRLMPPFVPVCLCQNRNRLRRSWSNLPSVISHQPSR